MNQVLTETKKTITLGVVVVLAACTSGGGQAEQAGAAAQEDFALVLDRVVNAVITPTYVALHDQAIGLRDCIVEFEAMPTEATLTACKNAWVAARVPWEQSEAFLFGPVTELGLDPAMDSWPVDYQQLQAVLTSSVALSAASITENLGGGMKGFHTIEYLLWGAGHERSATELAGAARDVEYLEALTAALADDSARLVTAWQGSGEAAGYGERFAQSGTEHGVYATQLDAVQELIGGMSAICDEVAFGKIAEPFNRRDPNAIESQFSYNSLLDFSDNMRSVQNLYLGSRDGTQSATSLATVIDRYTPDLNVRVKDQIDRAIAAILAIGAGGVTFRDAILDPRRDTAILRAQSEIAKLKDLLDGDVTPLFAK
jgi:predicted lipoprotein